MPHLRFRALKEEEVSSFSRTLVNELSEMTKTPADHYTAECLSTSYFQQGAKVEGDPFCEVHWFDRGQEVQDSVAQLITKHLKSLRPDKDAVVVFTKLERSGYYENGQHFGK